MAISDSGLFRKTSHPKEGFFRNLLIQRRLEKGFSQKELATLLGWSSGQIISNIERSTCGFPVDKALLLSEILCIDIEDIIQALKRDYEVTLYQKMDQKGRTPTFISWSSMRQRCNRKSKNKGYQKNYVQRGIRVCNRWGLFSNFLEDMGEKPSLDHSIDRIDNSKGYFLENCRWATPKLQKRNTRNNRLIHYDGITKCVAEWAEEKGIPRATLERRLFKYGWSVERAIEYPVRASRK